MFNSKPLPPEYVEKLRQLPSSNLGRFVIDREDRKVFLFVTHSSLGVSDTEIKRSVKIEIDGNVEYKAGKYGPGLAVFSGVNLKRTEPDFQINFADALAETDPGKRLVALSKLIDGSSKAFRKMLDETGTDDEKQRKKILDACDEMWQLQSWIGGAALDPGTLRLQTEEEYLTNFIDNLGSEAMFQTAMAIIKEEQANRMTVRVIQLPISDLLRGAIQDEPGK